MLVSGLGVSALLAVCVRACVCVCVCVCVFPWASDSDELL